jgi:predicted metal-binding protein
MEKRLLEKLLELEQALFQRGINIQVNDFK